MTRCSVKYDCVRLKFDARVKIKSFSIISSSTKVDFLLDTLMEQIYAVVIEMLEFKILVVHCF